MNRYFNFIDVEQNTQEWLDFRKNCIGASDAPIIMGVSPWKTPYELWKEKRSESKNETNYAMRRGTEMEPEARAYASEMIGADLRPVVCQSTIYPWAIASIDGMDEENTLVVEVKCPGEIDHNIALGGNIPEKYYPQIQHQLFVTGLPMALYFSYDGDEGCLVRVDRNDDYIKKMMIKEEEFFNSMLSGNAPDMTEKDYVEKGDEEWFALSTSLISLKNQIKLLQEREEIVRSHLIDLAGGFNCRGAGITMTSYIRKGNIDYSKIPQIKEIDLDQYRKPDTKTWRISYEV
jgi:putative phage-type endonuclease